jgi:hypothetical protein
MKRTVRILDFENLPCCEGRSARRLHNDRTIEGVSLIKARRIVERAARRGVKMYGGSIKRDNWGSCGGTDSYRTAVIV